MRCASEAVRVAKRLAKPGWTAAVLLMLSWSALAAESAGVVKTLAGSATITRDSSVLTAVPGQKVFTGDRVSAQAGSYVGITLHDDTRLAIGPRSELLIREYEFNASSHQGGLVIAFLRGTARVITGILAKQAPERVNFYTPTMTIGIRGTDFIVDLEGSQ
jgi:hypothetical protein